MKPGPKSKNALFSDAINSKKRLSRLTAAERLALRVRKTVLDKDAKKIQKDLDKTRNEIKKATEKLGGIVGGGDQEELEQEVSGSEVDNAKSAYRMLQDLRYAYRNSVGEGGMKGKSRLVKLMEDDKDFKFAVKELLKIEAALLSAKIRKDGDTPGEGSKGFLVVLKGLDMEKGEVAIGGNLDIKQIENALNPNAVSRETQEEVRNDGPPEQLMKDIFKEDEKEEGNADSQL